jgi:hypothetical protein
MRAPRSSCACFGAFSLRLYSRGGPAGEAAVLVAAVASETESSIGSGTSGGFREEMMRLR